jgi:hypothetical protein
MFFDDRLKTMYELRDADRRLHQVHKRPPPDITLHMLARLYSSYTNAQRYRDDRGIQRRGYQKLLKREKSVMITIVRPTTKDYMLFKKPTMISTLRQAWVGFPLHQRIRLLD